ncbi:serine/threonine-protein kinase [Vallitalea okinawensis]|uniref:serine/threonine-protein kinase n=1 Tax=Vallitalea okinawensis TaxID=2078660 RepID=UPI000CFC6F9D|nr:serine/threonine-protein kinase [Vallitalea okinawensis]
MSEKLDLIGKVISGYKIEEKIGSGAFGTVYKASKINESGKYTYALKHITIPNETEYKDILSSMCGDYSKANNYYKNILDGIVDEIKILRTLSEKNNANIVGYYDNDIEKTEQPFQYNIFLRMEYLTPVSQYLLNHQLTLEDVVDLGLDVLSALDLCHSNNVIHRDIKEDNIFISKDKRFKLGDFGIAKALKNKSKAASMKGTPAYIAPEVYLGKEEYNNTVDLYSLGIVMYRLLNFNRYPFVKPYPQDFDMDDVENAINRRLSGEIPDIPANAPEILGQILLKAVSNKADRYKSAKEFYNSLRGIKEQLHQDELDQVLNEDLLQSIKQNNGFSVHRDKKSENRDYAETVGVLGAKGKNRILSDTHKNGADTSKHKDLFESQGTPTPYQNINYNDIDPDISQVKYYTVGVTEIGLVGVSNGVGVTHTALMFANILGFKYKVALFELNDTGTFKEIKKIADPKNTGSFYKHNGIDYFCGMEYTEFVANYKENYDYVLLDFGSYEDIYDINDFIRTNMRLVIGQAIDWKLREIRSFYKQTNQYDPNATWNYLIPFINESELIDVKNIVSNKIYTIPFNKNPFLPSKEVEVVFYTIFNTLLGVDNKSKKKKGLFNVFSR